MKKDTMTNQKPESQLIVSSQDNSQLKNWYVSKSPFLSVNPMILIKNSESEGDADFEADVMLSEPELKEPSQYAVVMYNDNYTPMDFVVFVLTSEFRHTEDEAIQIMLNIHHQGKGVAGIYTKEIAETKATNVNTAAKHEGFPLMTQIEPNSGS